jgi:hypothetical protein
MQPKNILSSIIYLSLTVAGSATQAAPPPPQFLQFSPSATKGAIYFPDPVQFPNPHIGLINMHRTDNRMSHISMKEMASRGFVILGMNPRCENNESLCIPWENNALDLKQGIEYMRKLPGITKIVLLGGSGGGPTMSFYQAVAENGASFCQQAQKLSRCDHNMAGSLEGLPPADGIVIRDTHLGNGANALMSLNPAIINDEEIMARNAMPKIDPALDPFNPANGYNQNGPSTYSAEFRDKYFRAQSARMNRLIDIAVARLKQIDSGSYIYPDDAPFIIPGADDYRLMRIDLGIDHSTAQPRKLIKNDGTIEDCCVVESVRPVSSDPEMHEPFWAGTRMLSVRSFLSVRAIRSTHAMDEIDYCSSNNSTVCNVRSISVPLLVTAMGGHYFIAHNEFIYEQAASKDKDFVVLEGAVHGITPCTECMPAEYDGYDGRYDNSVVNYYDFVAKWIYNRF